ncbi:MAG: GntR family transcriptional regulator, partial [Phycisphaerae bacterium]|nr:GntR family transcriptional regulator [Phycisphaerae bacterium]
MDYGTQAVYDSKAPRIARRLAQDIAGGRFPQSSMLPPERELARSYGISRMTMRKVLSMLAERGDLVKVPQRGVMVAAGAAPIVSQTPTATALSRNGRSTIAAVWAAEPDVHLVDIREGVKRYAAENDLAFQMFLSSQGHDQALR